MVALGVIQWASGGARRAGVDLGSLVGREPAGEVVLAAAAARDRDWDWDWDRRDSGDDGDR